LLFGWPMRGVREASAGMAPNGTTCAASGDCLSGFCVDAVCCDSACDACSACSVAAGATTDGTCSPIVVCQAADDCHDAVCNPQSGACVQTKKPDGTPCDDHDVCTQNDAC